MRGEADVEEEKLVCEGSSRSALSRFFSRAKRRLSSLSALYVEAGARAQPPRSRSSPCPDEARAEISPSPSSASRLSPPLLRPTRSFASRARGASRAGTAQERSHTQVRPPPAPHLTLEPQCMHADAALALASQHSHDTRLVHHGRQDGARAPEAPCGCCGRGEPGRRARRDDQGCAPSLCAQLVRLHRPSGFALTRT